MHLTEVFVPVFVPSPCPESLSRVLVPSPCPSPCPSPRPTTPILDDDPRRPPTTPRYKDTLVTTASCAYICTKSWDRHLWHVAISCCMLLSNDWVWGPSVSCSARIAWALWWYHVILSWRTRTIACYKAKQHRCPHRGSLQSSNDVPPIAMTEVPPAFTIQMKRVQHPIPRTNVGAFLV